MRRAHIRRRHDDVTAVESKVDAASTDVFQKTQRRLEEQSGRQVRQVWCRHKPGMRFLRTVAGGGALARQAARWVAGLRRRTSICSTEVGVTRRRASLNERAARRCGAPCGESWRLPAATPGTHGRDTYFGKGVNEVRTLPASPWMQCWHFTSSVAQRLNILRHPHRPTLQEVAIIVALLASCAAGLWRRLQGPTLAATEFLNCGAGAVSTTAHEHTALDTEV